MSAPVVVCTWRGAGDDVAEETAAALTLGRRVAAERGTELRWLVLGPAPEDLVETARSHGVAVVDRIGDARLESPGPDTVVEAVARYSASKPAALIVFNQHFGTRFVVPRVAGRVDAAVVMNCTDVEVAESGGFLVTAAAYGGDTRAVYAPDPERMCVVALLANAVLPEPVETPAQAPPVEDVDIGFAGVEERVRIIEQARSEGPRLEDAEIIVAGGRGLGSPENFKLVEELAETLGGMAGASRPIVDEGWTDSAHQVGLTGRITRPVLYVAAGISGATQHMAGCSAAKTIVAINTDPDAAIFRYAKYGIVGDCLEVLPEMIRAVREAGVAR